MKCPDSIEELAEMEKLIPLCKATLYEQAQARLKKDPSKSERQVAREIAEELGRPENTVRTYVRRAKMDTLYPPKLSPSEEQSVIKYANSIKQKKREAAKEKNAQLDRIPTPEDPNGRCANLTPEEGISHGRKL